ncbi:MAG: S41 family peptidase [Minisyncoccia bacterium]
MVKLINFLKSHKILVFLQYLTIILGSLAIIFLCLYIGYNFGVNNSLTNKIATSTFDLSSNNLLNQTINIVKTYYYNASSVTNQDLLYGAASGIVNALNDPYSVFLTPSDAKKFNQDVTGNFGGIGAELGIKNSNLVIIAPLKNSPAEKAGIKSNDIIVAIDGTSTLNMSIDQAVKLIRGTVGTPVVLSILRSSWNKPKDFKIIRQEIQTPTLDSKMIDNNILYIHLYAFNSNANSLFYQAVLNGLINNAKGLILDLRGNPGGFLQTAIDLSGWFVKKGTVVVQEKSPGETEYFKAYGNEALANFPVVVLVDDGSASASEILAGALRDDRNIKLIGEKTFGKGTVQQIETLSDGSEIKISIAQWLTPKGYTIDKVGLMPDYKVPITDDDIKNNKDPQLQKAIQVLKELYNL